MFFCIFPLQYFYLAIIFSKDYIQNKTRTFIEVFSMSFGSPAADYIEEKLDLNRLLLPHPLSSYLLRMNSNRLAANGILQGDILVVDRSLASCRGKLVIVIKDEHFQIIPYPPDADFIPWGMVTSVIRKLA